jgi:hypothetical protein
VEAVAEAPRGEHSHRLIAALTAVSLLANAVVGGGAVALFASNGTRDWAVAELGLATARDVGAVDRKATATAAAAAAKADNAVRRASSGPTTGDLVELQSTVSSVELRLSAAEATVSDEKAALDAGCDWARLQETNFTDTSLSSIFFDYEQSVCGVVGP